MKAKEKWAQEYLDSIKGMERAPGLTDIFVAGFEFAKQEILAREIVCCDRMIPTAYIKNLGDSEITDG